MAYDLTKEAIAEAINAAVLVSVREVVREEIPQFSRIFFDPTQENSEIGCMYPITDDDIVYTDFRNNYVRRFLIQTGETVWKTTLTLPNPFGIDYDDVGNRLIIGYINGILILDASDGSTLNNITSFGIYNLSNAGPFFPIFNPNNTDEIYFTCLYQHVVVRLNLVTGSSVIFGTWGTIRADLTGFNYPYEVEVNLTEDIIYVADRYNSRILLLNMNLNAVKTYLYIMPYAHSVRLCRWGSTQQDYGMLALSSGEVGVVFMQGGRKTRFMMPLSAQCIRFNPDLTKSWMTSVFALEISLRNVLYQSPKEKFNYHFISLGAVGVGGMTTRPVLGMLYAEFLIRIYSDQAGVLSIQVPDSSAGFGNGLEVPTGFTWVNYAVALAVTGGGVVDVLNLDPPPPVFRLNFIPALAATTVTLDGFGTY